MISNDLKRDNLRAAMQQALRENDTEKFYESFNDLIKSIGDDLQEQYNAAVMENDSRILAQRGVRQLTSQERDYYQKVAEAMQAKNPRQAITDLDVAMPTTILDAVFDELQTSHPLLSRIDFMPTSGITEMIINTNGYQEAVWGKLCDEIVKELTS